MTMSNAIRRIKQFLTFKQYHCECRTYSSSANHICSVDLIPFFHSEMSSLWTHSNLKMLSTFFLSWSNTIWGTFISHTSWGTLFEWNPLIIFFAQPEYYSAIQSGILFFWMMIKYFFGFLKNILSYFNSLTCIPRTHFVSTYMWWKQNQRFSMLQNNSFW